MPVPIDLHHKNNLPKLRTLLLLKNISITKNSAQFIRK